MTLRGLVPTLAAFAAIPALAGGTIAEPASLHSRGSLFRGAGGLVTVSRLPVEPDGRVQAASLFVGRVEAGLFAPPRQTPGRASARSEAGASGGMLRLGGSQRDGILDIIGFAESRRHGYDAVQHAATVPPPRRPTALSIAEIFQWIEDTPGQQHAIGRYQFIPQTLSRLVRDLGIDEGALFTPRLQDRLADRLLLEAGLHRFRAGTITRHQFMNNLAEIWAGLPTANGRSHYHGFAGNRATMSWAQFDAAMAQVFPG